jgi:uncharacterized DUF497 family protein
LHPRAKGANVYTETSSQGCRSRFTWDERKDRINRKKHGISFETAVLVFNDPWHISRQDREVEGELRWQTIGILNNTQILLVAHTISESEDEDVIRIISARKATRQERSIYAQEKHTQ